MHKFRLNIYAVFIIQKLKKLRRTFLWHASF